MVTVTANSGQAWLLALRPRTLGASVVPVVVGVLYAARSVEIDGSVAVLTAIAALALQIATNLANDYYDHARGIDTDARLGPTRAVQAGLLPATTVRRVAFAAIGVALAVGVVLGAHGGWPILAIGATAAVAALAYSAGPAPLAALGFGEVLAFTFFGWLAVAGSAWLQGLAPTPELLLVATPLAMLVTAIMVVNNLRDIPTDCAAGKRTLAVQRGADSTRRLYVALVLGAFAALPLLAPRLGAPILLPFLLLPVAWREAQQVRRRDGAELNLSLAGTARLHLLFGIAFSLGMAMT